MMTLRIALERAGIVLPDDEPAPVADEPTRGSLEWVARPHGVPVGRVISDYDPWSRERLK